MRKQLRLTSMNWNVLSSFLLLIFSISSCTKLQSNAKAIFPGTVSESISPNGKLKIVNVDNGGDSISGSIDANHALYLVDVKDQSRKLIYRYDRHVEIVWSTTGEKCVINDYAGSNYSLCIFFDVKNPELLQNITDQVIEYFRKESGKSSLDHLYCEGVRWRSDEKLVVNVRGFGGNDSNEFTFQYEYSLDKNVISKVL